MAGLFLVLNSGAQGGPYTTLDVANKDGTVTHSYSLFINSVFSFTILSWFAFVLVKGINRIKDAVSQKVGKATKSCQFCYSLINVKAFKCPQCTASLD